MTRSSSGQAGLGELLAFLPFIVALVMVIIGIQSASSGCAATGLMWIGGGIALGGIGGTLTVRTPYIAIGGAGGLVLLLVGAILRASMVC